MRIRRESNGLVWIPDKNPALEAELDKLYKRVPGQLQWWSDEKPSILKDAISFIRTVTSGFASPDIVEKRKNSCIQCPALLRTQKGLFCGGCNCGTWQLAALDGSYLPKLSWAGTTCPLQRPGFANSG